ncbi:pyridoxamine 5'-phosphate oxidase family protein [Micromonospora radicis]|uniref:Pyridoxamine 5'-phosphate oxidase n=1 Tax=Micromonospora radicis TaxID=1894971 RepID=A0A418MVB5_9ACTN|nr:pyridoxamine 5'-phosphate oxidase family protein [Micromonospora radicis]RIV38433.1 pyridoxamine 5'-phosphate oxidase [Micromonospora radicis]
MSDEATTVRAARRRVTELIRAAGTCTLTTISLDGRLVGRPMLLQRTEFDGELWFVASAKSATVRQLRVNPEVEVSFGDPDGPVRVSLSGSARDDYDPVRARQLWQPGLTAWFPGGPETAGLTTVAVHVTGGRCWDRRGRRWELIGRPEPVSRPRAPAVGAPDEGGY